MRDSSASHNCGVCVRSAFVISMFALMCLYVASAALADDAPKVSGSLIANGTTIELPYAYVWAEEKGFYDEADPTWTVLFAEHPIEERELDGIVGDSAWVKLGITQTAEFGDEPKLQVYMQSVKLAADSGGNISGGKYPKLELTTAGPERFAGRVYHEEPQTFFDDTFQYDLTFDLPLSDPNAPLGEALPADGGEPGRAYLKWVAAIHAGDAEQLKSLVPPEMVTQLEEDDVAEQMAFMQALTPTEVKILSGSSDGETAILQIEGLMDGERAKGEVTLKKMGGHWVPTRSAW